MLSLLADTVLTAPEILEVLNNVHEFYDQAWNKLIWTLAAIGFVVAILIPWWMERRRKESFDAVHKELGEATDRMAEVEKQIGEANEKREALWAQTKAQIQDAHKKAVGQLTDLREDTKRRLALLEGRMRSQFAFSLRTREGLVGPEVVFTMYCGAAERFFVAGDREGFRLSLESAVNVSRKAGASVAIRADKEGMKYLRTLLSDAITGGLAAPHDESVKALQDLLADAPPDQAEDSNEGEGEKTGQDGAGATQTPPADS